MIYKQKAIICDLDGTLFDCEWRSKKYLQGEKKDFDAFNSVFMYDEIIPEVENIVKGYRDKGYAILFVSGRPDNHYRLTMEKLFMHRFYCKDDAFYKEDIDKQGYYLFMRKEGDFIEDEVIKEEIYNENIKDKYNVLFCIDDRPKICRMWRKLGLFCLQVNDKEF